MTITVCAVIALVLLLAGNVFINFQQKKDLSGQKEEVKPVKNNLLIPDSKTQAIYFIISFVAITVLAGVFYFSKINIHILIQIKMICLVSTLVPIAYIDYQKHIIPNLILIVSVLIRVVLYLFEFIFLRAEFWEFMKMSLIGALAIGGFFIVCAFVFKNSVGMGDVKMLIVIALYQGISGAFASIFISLIISFILSIVLLASRKKSRKDQLAFAPCVLIGTYISMVLIGG